MVALHPSSTTPSVSTKSHSSSSYSDESTQRQHLEKQDNSKAVDPTYLTKCYDLMKSTLSLGSFSALCGILAAHRAIIKANSHAIETGIMMRIIVPKTRPSVPNP